MSGARGIARLALAGVLAWAAAGAARAAERPDFSGRWTLAPARSEFGKVPGGQPLARTDVIEQRGQHLVHTLHLQNAGSRDTAVYRYVADSSRVTNRVAGQSIHSRAWWEGGALRVDSRTKLLLILDTTLSERWTLSPDRRTLTISRRVTWPGGTGDQKLVFEKR